MATHPLFLGGARTQAVYPPSMFPARDVNPDDSMATDNTRGDILFSNTRRLIWKESFSVQSCNYIGSDALSQYYACNTIATGDIIQTHILPRWSSLERVWVNVEEAVAGFTFQLRVRGNSASNGGTTAVPVPITVGPVIDGGVVGSQLILLDDPIYFDQNDMLEMVLVSVPATGIECSNISISPVVMEYCRGFN
jgi:hypothetical protein